MDVATAKALLQRQEGANGSVYDALTEAILKVLTAGGNSSLSVFAAATAGAAGTGDARHGGEAAAAEHSAAVSARLASEVALMKAPIGEDGSATAIPAVQDLTEEAQYLSWAGVSFGRTSTFRLHLSLKHLAAKQSARNVRFWGKIFGRSADYYIAETEVDGVGDEPGNDALGHAIHKGGEGPNKHTYFFCHDIGEGWQQLPNVTPHQIIVARKIRRVFSGNPDAAVAGHPPFPGVERNYLRAQIALISAGTVLAPVNAFTPPEEDASPDVLVPADEWEASEPSDMANWVHLGLELNEIGRTRADPPKEGAEEGDEPAGPEPSAPLRSAADDPPVLPDAAEGGGAWDLASLPRTLPPDAASEPAAVVTVLRSLRWPGAACIGFARKRWANVYVGHGHEAAVAGPFQLPLPGALPVEYNFSDDGNVVEDADVVVDPDAGKVVEGEDGQDGDA